MLKLLKQIIGVCDHKWVEAYRADLARRVDSKKVGTRIVTKCEKCGAFKKWDMT